MGRNKDTRKRVRSYERRLAEHHEKVAAELRKPNPDYGLIRHWEGEMRGFEKTLARLKKRLPGGRA